MLIEKQLHVMTLKMAILYSWKVRSLLSHFQNMIKITANTVVNQYIVLLRKQTISILSEEKQTERNSAEMFFNQFVFRCKHCTHYLFCNEKCFNLAYDLFHKWECDGSILLSNLGVGHLAFRSLLIAARDPFSLKYEHVNSLLTHLNDVPTIDLLQYVLVREVKNLTKCMFYCTI